MPDSWTPDSWQQKPVAQRVEYPDAPALGAVLDALRRLPPLVTSGEVESLKLQLAEAARGDRFLLLGGDCAESFDDCRSEVIAAKVKILLKMSIVLVHGSGRRVIRMGRLAGQYAKPRSASTETRDGQTLPSYRGDLINRRGFTLEDRTPDPTLLLRGYERAALTLNFLRALVQGGFTDFRHPGLWDLEFVNLARESAEYRARMDSVVQSVRFMETLAGRSLSELLSRAEIFAAHEGLHLDYEQAQTRQVPRRQGWYNLSAHFPWIGDRTRAVDGAHVEYFRGIANPIGVKLGPRSTPEEVLALCETLNPDNEPGRLTLIHRFGANEVERCLPPLLQAVHRARRLVLWCCDPMHGNTITASSGLKTRNFDDILRELNAAFDVHRATGTVLGGVHFELTGENVTECIGGARGLTEADLTKAYRSDVDPRLNYEQAMEMALLIARRMSPKG
ncbi:MAG: 3-deoxy-7-phosphoheptulonate synthase class II [Planctomycetota bacterium]